MIVSGTKCDLLKLSYLCYKAAFLFNQEYNLFRCQILLTLPFLFRRHSEHLPPTPSFGGNKLAPVLESRAPNTAEPSFRCPTRLPPECFLRRYGERIEGATFEAVQGKKAR